MRWRHLALAAGVTWGCTSPTDPREVRIEGILTRYPGDQPQITLPDTVEVGEPVLVEVITYPNGCTRMDETEVEIETLMARVTPYDVQAELDLCERIPDSILHRAFLQFDRKGVAQVTVRGRAAMERDLVSYQRTVVVE